MRERIPCRAFLWTLLLLVLASCRPSDPPPQVTTQTFTVKGVIERFSTNGRTVIIHHEEIPDYMAEMIMPFEVKDTNELAGLTVGDQVVFQMLVTEEEGWIEGITKVGRAPTPPKPRPSIRRVPWVEPLEIGDPIPDHPLTNQFGQAFSLSQYRENVLAITFIYTRCPYPNFCPRMSKNFAETAQLLKNLDPAIDNWRLLSVSFDPEYDTPEVLKQYAETQSYDPDHWTFATGEMEVIDTITEEFGLTFGRVGEIIDHNVRTVVVDAAGNVHTVLPGNEWIPQDLVDAIIAARDN